MTLTLFLLQYSVLENVTDLKACKTKYLNNSAFNEMRAQSRFSCEAKISFKGGCWPITMKFSLRSSILQLVWML
jgi:hypothetical protein